MATKGLKYPVYAIYSEDGGVRTYSQGAVAGKSITVSVQYDINNERIYGDDALQLSDQSILGGTITLGLTDLTIETRAILLGHKRKDSPQNGFIISSDDIAPFVGFGFYGQKAGGGYRSFWYYKVQFGEPNDELETKRDRTTFKTPTISGVFGIDITNNVCEILDWETEAAAKAYLDDMAGIKAKCRKPVASKASGTYTGTQTVTLTAGEGETIYYTLTGLTPSATTGTEYSTAITISESCALRAIAVKAGNNDSDIATYEYIIT